MNSFWLQVLTATVGGLFVALIIGFITWLYHSYKRFCSMDDSLKVITLDMSKALPRLEIHEERLDGHDVEIAELKNQ